MVNRAWRVGRLAQIDVSVHWTFVLLMIWIILASWQRGPMHVMADVGLVLSLFACVVLHELGHALAARAFGIPTHGITLLPIGGVAQLDRIPKNPAQESIIAIAGPAVNVVIVGILFPLIVIVDSGLAGAASTFANGLLPRLAWMNVGLTLFNLIPAFPMDGGRLLRARLAKTMGYVSATRRAARTGQVIAGGLFIAGWTWNPMLMLVAAFVAIAAQGEFQHVRHEHEPVAKGLGALRNASRASGTEMGIRARASRQPKSTAVCWTLPNGVVVIRPLQGDR